MRLERLLHVSLALTTALGSLCLSLAEMNLWLVVAAWAGLSLSFYVTDTKRWFQLNTLLANLAGLGALAVALSEYFLRVDDDSRLLAMTNMLVYLQIVVQFQTKTRRVIWQLILLSFLQVAVAAALSLHLGVGLLLLAYEALLLVTLMLFLLHRETQRFAATPCLVPMDLLPADGFRGAASAQDLAGTRPAALAALAGRIITLSLPLVVLFFCLIPRSSRARAFQFSLTTQRAVGFSEQVKLTESGPIHERSDHALRVSFFDAAGQPVRISGDLALRGSVLSRYWEGSWEKGRLRDDFDRGAVLPAAGLDVTRLEISLQSLDSQTLFAVYPIRRVVNEPEVQFFAERRQLIFAGRNRPKSFSYAVESYAIRDGRVEEITPVQMEFGAPNLRHLLQLPDGLPGDPSQPDPSVPVKYRLTALRALAAEAVAQLPPLDVARRARALTAVLQDPRRFSYDLDAPARDPGLDPIEDFIAIRPEGHCEYFASALALMLRSQGIPSRLVVGYRTGEWNSFGKYYQVKQLHAHSWVEAFLLPHQLPPECQGPAWRYGGWLRLDPTPSGSDVQAVEITAWDHVKHFIDYGQLLWSTYVLDMNVKRQQESIYEPMRNAIDEHFRGWFQRKSWQERLPKLTAWLQETFGENWFSALGLIGLGLLTLAAAAFIGLLRAVLRRWWSLPRRGKRAPGVRRSAVEFYARFEAILRRYRLVRTPSQTAHEFAVFAGGHLADRPQTHRAAGAPRRICELFYRVRFGGASLDNQEIEAVEHALAELSASLAKSGPSS